MKILIIKNISRESPGLLEDVLLTRSIRYDVIDLSAGEEFPELKDYGAVVVFGGPDSANDETEKTQKELSRIAEAVDSKIPYLGICLGMQLLAKAAGGKVVNCSAKEIGFSAPDGNNFTVELTDKGKNDPLLENLGDSIEVFHLHGETVKLTDEISLLATGKFCENQIIKVGENGYGIQSHFELTAEMLKLWLEEDPDLQELDKSQTLKYFKKIENEYSAVGRRIFNNFLDLFR
ncbi:MAG: type 1 glutamine amidotransferase [Chlorobi bacterium]|nr:type 1 glutamine amidotransferase [Chlorobiota bacterium]